MLYTYTAVITESDGTFYAKVPDIDGCITTAKSLSEAITLITGALNLCLVVLEDENIQPVPPTPQADIPMLRLIYSPSSRLIQSNTAALQIQSKKVIHISTSIEEYIELTFLRRKLFIKNKKNQYFQWVRSFANAYSYFL